MKGKLAVLQKPEKVSAEEGYKKLIAEPEKRNADLVQVSDDLYTVLVKQAPEAQEKLELRTQTRQRSAIQQDGKSVGRLRRLTGYQA